MRAPPGWPSKPDGGVRRKGEGAAQQAEECRPSLEPSAAKRERGSSQPLDSTRNPTRGEADHQQQTTNSARLHDSALFRTFLHSA
eukprot:13041157-Alexandrium_andersonii.AAC.1